MSLIKWLLKPVLGDNGEDSKDIGNLNNYIDNILGNLKKDELFIHQIDPLIIPDIDEGKFKTSLGVIRGLSTLQRIDDCTLSYEGDTVRVEGYLGVRDIYFNVNYKAKAILFWIKGIIEGKCDSLSVRMSLIASQGNMRLDSFKVTHFSDFKVTRATGLSIMLNWLLRLILNNIAHKSRSVIINVMESFVSQFIQENISKFQFPLNAL
ncbi:uncharacterized protein LOC111640818 [Centruroides sculpturatus]|uniref:uncharacterized protein LOC111640818 n=1 Tax=Centruroides sculpturatus TaxID=218467 RepID=UPI000C6D2114|nr:uncharacterized protein LOC111640818 [Centruroides sculpturatus]